MAGIVEKPTNFRVYYKSAMTAYTQKKEEATAVLKDLQNTLIDLYSTVSNDFNANEEEFDINLNNYKEYIDNKYIDGKFLRVAKGVLLNRKGGYELIGRNFDIYRLAKTQKEIYDIKQDIVLYDKVLSLNMRQYNNLLKLFYTKVQEKLIIDGFGYAFEGMMGWVCINRCKVVNAKPRIDYKATKEREAQLRAEGKRIYNKEEAEWCEKNGLEYKAEDKRVFQNLEYLYEFALIGCKLKDGNKIKFTTSDYRGTSVRGKSNNDILIESGGDKYKICDYDIDVRTKLTICLEADKLLYAKFIRNEDQTPSSHIKANSKN